MSRDPATRPTDREKAIQDPRAKRKDEQEVLLDRQLDHELEDSFPASDPPSLTQDQR